MQNVLLPENPIYGFTEMVIRLGALHLPSLKDNVVIKHLAALIKVTVMA